ncbi:MAG: MMPL family transporter [Actinobacteria bacterium]|nr:MMPL family transporter [Actinomycetota bacterium]
MSDGDPDPIAAPGHGVAWGLGRAIVWARFLVVAAWIAAALLATSRLPSGLGQEGAQLGSLLPRSSKALAVEARSLRTFGFPLISRSMVVARKDGGFDAAAGAAALRFIGRTDRSESGLKAVPFAAEGRPLEGGPIGDTLLVYLYVGPSTEDEATTASEHFAAGLRRASGAETTHVTGAIPAATAERDLVEENLPWVEIATVVLVVGILLAYYRSLVIPLLCVAAVGLAYVISDRLLGLIAERFGLIVPEEVEPVVIALLFGVLTDYLVFFLSGFRTRLERGERARDAASAVTGELLPVVSTAALMIAGATITLSLSGVDFLAAFGPAMAISVLVAAVVSLTLLPAILALLGRFVFLPRRVGSTKEGEAPSGDAGPPKARRKVLGLVARHPLPVVALCLVALLAAASGLRSLELGNPIIRGLPTSTQSRQGYDEASQALGPGVVGPAMLVVEGEGVGGEEAALGSLQGRIEAQPGIARVLGPAQQPASLPPGVFVAPDHSAARFLIVLEADPDGPVAPEILSRLESRLPRMIAQSGLHGASFGLAGDTSVGHELTEDTWQAGLKVAPVALAVLLLLLWALLRSRAAPLYLVGSSLLVTAASLGLTVYVFQGMLGYNELAFFVPVATAILMLALGADYNVFLISRIWREAERRDLRAAIRTAGSRASSAIAVAGLILALSFTAVWLIPIAAFRELAFALFVGLMLDTWVARPLLVPALVGLFGASTERAGNSTT